MGPRPASGTSRIPGGAGKLALVKTSWEGTGFVPTRLGSSRNRWRSTRARWGQGVRESPRRSRVRCRNAALPSGVPAPRGSREKAPLSFNWPTGALLSFPFWGVRYAPLHPPRVGWTRGANSKCPLRGKGVAESRTTKPSNPERRAWRVLALKVHSSPCPGG
jgi:hypothetical protein